MRRYALVLFIPLFIGCGGPDQSHNTQDLDTSHSDSLNTEPAMGSSDDSAPTAACTTTDDIVVYTTFDDGQESLIQVLGGCGHFGDTDAFLRKTVGASECNEIAPASANPELTGNEPRGTKVKLQGVTDRFGPAC